jgi:hypothetical protein
MLVRAPHRSAELTPYDYSCFVPPARVLNVPAVLEALSGHVMGAGAALLVVLQTVPTAASTMAPTIAELRASSTAEHVASMVIVRRQTHAARLVGDAWHAQATGSSSGTPNPLPQSVVTSTVAMLSPTDPATPLLLLPNEAHAHEWWEWWRCVAKGQGPESLTGKLRLSRCCKPTHAKARATCASLSRCCSVPSTVCSSVFIAVKEASVAPVRKTSGAPGGNSAFTSVKCPINSTAVGT